MKRLFASAAILMLVGAGCAGRPDEDLTEYANAQYGFAFDYPDGLEVRVRPDDVRAAKYLGLDVDFFASLRDLTKGEKPENIAFFYAAEGLSADTFVQALEGSGPAIAVKSREDLRKNGIALTKITSTTESGEDKTHYLFDRGGHTVIVSEFLYQHELFAPILESVRTHKP
ncbi:hypothetical protein A2856_04200 [Candidatus Uhrbacteria bacterium RIFCSPHIGHO2_01_FULL_63_20]|uniref:Uncharacterized protein n=1 Tax=Candidatus Uhrbacteria bacterium RIFCSPHIGHO2_01_FULL_63_20 TaxID=1802385 RepID=A0A1F7TNN8_9BACT|nr:MAG: hypothetical protein A2856_04200 [Candidatus Uhrbacteria bacterium RIFCSPHIGHO2_01_FULL_63_20]